MLSGEQKIRRGFHWLAVFLAAILLAGGLVLMIFDVGDLWHTGREDITTSIGDLSSARLGSLSLAWPFGPPFALSGGSWLGSIVDTKTDIRIECGALDCPLYEVDVDAQSRKYRWRTGTSTKGYHDALGDAAATARHKASRLPPE